jgi:UDP-N-acetylmuramate dehydrogenase
MTVMTAQASIPYLRSVFGDKLKTDVPLARYTAARVGGPARTLVVVESVDDLAFAAQQLWAAQTPFIILGGGSNVLVSDVGVQDVVLLNRAREIRFVGNQAQPAVWAGSGANFGSLARRAAAQGLSGLEWAAGIPGTVGGAVFGNAGAHGNDVAGCLLMAEILHQNGRREELAAAELKFTYRSSRLKAETLDALVLAAQFKLVASTPDVVQQKMDEFNAFRRRTQPPGASMGSMFKNPPGDYSGRLIEQAGLKGTRIGDAEISNLHANFFLNYGDATAREIFELIELARDTVKRKFKVNLELEIELLGEW